MADSDTGARTQAPGAQGEGQDAYPTYRDGPRSDHKTRAGAGPPARGRTSASPMLMGLIGFGVILVLVVVWAVFNLTATNAPSDPGNPSAATPTQSDGTAQVPDTGIRPAETAGSGTAGPGAVSAEPGAVDVPGGQTTTPVPATTTP